MSVDNRTGIHVKRRQRQKDTRPAGKFTFHFEH